MRRCQSLLTVSSCKCSANLLTKDSEHSISWCKLSLLSFNMALYAQHGHAKSDKITNALDAGILKGVIFSPRNELPENLQECITELHAGHEADLLIDPKFYVAALPRPREMKLRINEKICF